MAEEIYTQKKKQEATDKLADALLECAVQGQVEAKQAATDDKPKPPPNPKPTEPRIIPNPNSPKPPIRTGNDK